MRGTIADNRHDYSGGGVRGVKGTIAETIQTFTKLQTLGLNTML